MKDVTLYSLVSNLLIFCINLVFIFVKLASISPDLLHYVYSRLPWQKRLLHCSQKMVISTITYMICSACGLSLFGAFDMLDQMVSLLYLLYVVLKLQYLQGMSFHLEKVIFVKVTLDGL